MENVELQGEEAVIRPIVTTPPMSRQSRADELRSISSSSPGSGTQHSSSTSAVSLGEAIAQRAKQGVESWGQLPTEEDGSQLTMASVSRLGQTSPWPGEVHTQHDSAQIQEGLVTMAEDTTVQHPKGRSCSFQLEFQDSRLSPALPLFPDQFDKLHSLAEDTLFHQTDLEFVALRGSPDISVASERFPMPHQVSGATRHCPSKVSQDHPLLLQNPLSLSVASVEEANSCCSLSQHTLSPFSEDGEQDAEHIRAALEEMQQEREPCYGVAGRPPTHTSDGKEQSTPNARPQEKSMGAKAKISGSFLSGNIGAPLLLELPLRDVRLSSSSSVVSSASETSVNKGSSSRGSTGHKPFKPEEGPSSRQEEFTEPKKAQQEISVGAKLDRSRSSLEQEPSAGHREHPLGGVSCSSSKQAKRSRGTLDFSRRSEESNITTRSFRGQRDDDSDALREQLCCEIEKARQSAAQEAESHSKLPGSRSVTPKTCSLGTYSGRESTIVEVPTGINKTVGQLSEGFSFERGHTERELSSFGNRTAVDGSFLGSLSQPVSQSTPGVFLGPPRPSVQPPIGKLSPIESNPEMSQHPIRAAQSCSSIPHLAPAFDISVRDPSGAGPGTGTLKDSSLKSTGKIHALPSLNYMEKVGAWNVNQTSGKTFYDNLALRGFSGVSPKKKAFDAISDSLNRMLSQEGSSKPFQVTSASGASSHSPRRNLAASFSGTLSIGEDPGGGSCSASPLDRYRSHSSLSPATRESAGRPGSDLAGPDSSGTSKTGPPQREPGQSEQESCHDWGRTEPAGQQEAKEDKDESARGTADPGSAEEPQDAAQPLTRLGLDHFSDISSNRDVSITLASSQDSCHFERRLAASTGAVSSVVSLEVDNYAPYWNPSPSSSANQGEINIEERIPMYLHNLGIDQSPSAILTPFMPKGPIREPEFSPTDLCTLTGTPTKSTQPSEEGTPPKGEFSRRLSVGSNASIPLSIDSLQPIMPFSQHAADRPLSERCLQTSFRPLDSLPQGSPQPSAPDTAPHLSDSSDDLTASRVRELIEKFQSVKTFVAPGNLSSPEAQHHQSKDSSLDAKPSSETSNGSFDQGADSFVGSKTLQEIRKLLGRAESIVSGKSSISSSPPSLRGSDDSLLCLKQKLDGFQDSFASSTGNQETPSSLLWGRSSSESMLTSDGMKESASSELCRSPRASSHSFAQGKGAFVRSLDSISSQAAESVPTKSVRRSEPEGCSASAPDRGVPVFVSVMQVNPPTPSGGAQRGPAPETTSPTESPVSGPAESSRAPSPKEAAKAIDSDSSSADTLMTRVAALLRNGSPATMTSSSASTADEDERRAREWIKLKVSGQQCEKLQLNVEDRQCIEEIKRELLHNTEHLPKSQMSTDTDSSSHSSAPWGQPPGHPGQFHALKTAEHQLSNQLQRLNHNDFDSSIHLQPTIHQDLEARVRDIAQREGAPVPRTSPPPITSITIASCRRSPTPSTSPARSLTPLHLGHLATDAIPQPATGGPASESREPAAQPKVDITVQVSADAESAVETEDVTPARSSPRDLGPGSEPGPDLPDGSLPLSEAGVRSRQDTLGTGYTASYDFDTSSTAGDGSRMGSRRARCGADRGLRPAFHLDPTSYQHISRSAPNISSSSSLEWGADPLYNSTLASGSCSIDSPARKVLSHVHLTLSPKQPHGNSEGSTTEKPAQQDQSPVVKGAGMERGTGLPSDFSTRPTSQNPLSMDFMVRGHLFPDGHPPANRRSYFPDSRVTGSTNEWLETAFAPSSLDQQGAPVQPIRREGRETADASVQITTHAPREVSWGVAPATGFPQSFTSQHGLPGLLSIQTPAVPVLLPYKPHGSPELFYIPRSEEQPSPIRSDHTTIESSHPGSDDAVPPKFTPEVLGSRDQEEGEAVTSKHPEGIYSKRLMGYSSRQGHTGLIMAGNRTEEERQIRGLYPPSLEARDSGGPPRGSDAPQIVPSSRSVPPPSRDHGPPGRQLSVGRPSLAHSLEDGEEFAPLRGEETYSTEDLRPRSTQQLRPPGGSHGEEPAREWDVGLGGVSSQGGGSGALQELWQRFNERRSQREATPPVVESDTPLLERLERLSRLIHGDLPLRGRRERAAGTTRREEKRSGREGEDIARRGRENAREAWAEEGVEQEESQSPNSTDPSLSRHRCPAERDGSSGETASTISTIDTARLLRAFGPHRVQINPGLGRLYDAIDRQRDGKEHRRGRKRASGKPPAPAPPETDSTNDSTMSTVTLGESASSDSALQRGPPGVLGAKKTVKLVNKAIQTGDLEIVVNGTRKHTRDVGTTFPSPVSARDAGGPLPGSGGHQGEETSPPKSHIFMSEKRSKKDQVERYAQGVSWFVPADSLKADAKENQPESGALSGPGPGWFEPYAKTKPWREPLREMQVQEEPVSTKRRSQSQPITRAPTDGKASSALVRLTLQEALEMRRPDFVSRSRERIKRLELQVEERRLQAVFEQEREQLFNRPGLRGQPFQPTGFPLHRTRVIPRKEMFKRSKQIYSQLPEVQQRIEEEKRKAEYHSYRLKAQLYKKKITNRILGRKTAWQ
ncbi:hypothetical protein AAFF_G00274850 [Aldrovandia affinis]|uniref:ALMS motif domain-containing protein n=1 Tax=Aldrovandia affinis TaxID=143900 RepID=A0AAD7ST15_9TELE|nr:hypothetical protein AAFF_G00274850 [Aldrovandia affinis]